MQSIPQALAWEAYQRGKWALPGFLVLANLLPLIVFGALASNHVSFTPMDPTVVILQYCFLPLFFIQAALGILHAQGTMSRLYAAPISTSSLVAWHMFPGAIVLGLEVVLSYQLSNWLFGMDMPILGLVLFSMVAWCSLQSMIHTTHHSLIGLAAKGIPLVLFSIWFRSRCGAWNAPLRLWKEVTFIEFGTCMLFIAATYWLTVLGVRRDRCAEQIFNLGISDWMIRQWDSWTARGSIVRPPFRSPQRAQLWFEFRQKGLAMPVLFLFVLILPFMVWCVMQMIPNPSRTASLDDIQRGIVICGGLLSAVGVAAGLMLGLGTISGNRNHSFSKVIYNQPVYDMTQFQATRPMTSTQLSSAILGTGIASVLAAWILWASVFLGYLVITSRYESFREMISPRFIGGWYFPLTILGPWIAITSVAAMGLTGRGTVFGLSIVFAVVGYNIVLSFVGWLTSITIAQSIHCTCLIIVALALLGLTIVSYRAALSRRLIQYRTAVSSACVAVVVVVAGNLLSPMPLGILVCSQIIAIGCLTVLPFAAVPLAIRWNRHR